MATFLLMITIVMLYKQNQTLSEIINYEKGLEIGDEAYIFEAIDLNGNNLSIKSTNALLIFFNTSCEACILTAHIWQELNEKYSSDDFKIVGISKESIEITRNFIAEYGLTFQIILDKKKRISKKYWVKYSPQIVMVDRRGTIIYYPKFGIRATIALKEAEQIIKNLNSTKEF